MFSVTSRTLRIALYCVVCDIISSILIFLLPVLIVQNKKAI